MPAVPLLNYTPSTQNQRVASFGIADRDEDSYRAYRLEDVSSPTEIDELIWASYRQIFSEHQILESNRQKALESQLKNGSLSVRDFVRGLAKSEVFYERVVSVNNNYRLVSLLVRRLLGRDSYNKGEEIAWSIVIGEQGYTAFVDALVDSDEYEQNFGENTVPYQRKRFGSNTEGRPFNLVTPRYGEDYRENYGVTQNDWRFTLEKFYSKKFQQRYIPEGDPRKFLDVARSINPKVNYAQSLRAADIDYLAAVPYRGRR
ncbi:phycobilisome rod-core linker polypeptide [Leptolyngbya sp. FACHB-261]|uniref:phycobilisome rod-core linker polypeptide n=1 Tax=Leptolyngbya sp. FACHB-261 TaxID=2692806 RepID=UPI001682DE54|nr:phycobilisome rod-core linker polypeptide [Leptolyngbya sp. FACHB-261]MBD2104514.1 phycobilisome rod-core linker polypeptide [Leptolyngbya sp. FACHB-261]